MIYNLSKQKTYENLRTMHEIEGKQNCKGDKILFLSEEEQEEIIVEFKKP